jgi:hypothetical protein
MDVGCYTHHLDTTTPPLLDVKKGQSKRKGMEKEKGNEKEKEKWHAGQQSMEAK